ncbi:MAG: tRNA-dihydrouridine synthase family protein, partial [Deltaproteobacteria bacterium]|nr:tRNA-dihydrouridine synthase family protein [Deltaproteobacteria bacterium]
MKSADLSGSPPSVPVNPQGSKLSNLERSLGALKLKNPFILAPMAGLTDWPYRRLAVLYGAALTVSEMISAVSLAHRGRTTLKMLLTDPALERPFCVQLFGKDPQTFSEAAKVAVNEFGADAIDINMGCPARKVLSSGHGGALLKDLPLAA